MAPSFVRSSKFRHVFGTGAKRPDNTYEYEIFFYTKGKKLKDNNIVNIIIKKIKHVKKSIFLLK